LHTAAPGLDGAGVPLAGVLDDIDGQLRNGSTPDIGADEFTIGVNDVTPPTTSFVTGIANNGWTNQTSAAFTWTGADDITIPSALRFQYRQDGGAWSSPAYATGNTFSGLTQGAHTVSVAAIDQVGNVDPAPPVRSFTVDLTAPQASFVSGPGEGVTIQT